MELSNFDQLLTPVIVLDLNQDIKYFNHICSVFFQIPPRKLSKIQKINELFETSSYDFSEAMSEVINSQAANVSPEITFEKANGDQVTIICKFIPIEDKLVVNIWDLSIERKLHEKYKNQIQELRETHDQIVKADKLTALGEMISGISHEISSPLMIVTDRLDLLSRAIDDGDLKTSKEIMENLGKEYQRLLRIISGIKSVVKNQEDSLEVVSLNSLVNDVLAFFDELSPKVKLNLCMDAQESHLVMANPIKLQQVLINLVKNAIDALNDNGQTNGLIEIKLEVDPESHTQVIKVADNGPGINDAIKDQVFDMFFTSKELGEGTGLGLAISKKIIDAHSGNIKINDTDNGCEFEIRLPCIEIGSFTLTNKYLTGQSQLEGEKLLFISSDIEILNAVYKLLGEEDYVLIFSNDYENVADISDFMLVDYSIILTPVHIDLGLEDVMDLSKLSLNEKLKKLEQEFCKK